ncbi:VCBS repeat-containing protein [Glycomyces sp. NPDC021274]|uniref:FG-GAP repeat domain-containing protein n=1 Tax=Glycomyces sp. NPDC021274 TaxID=3155120 RepID=UPI0033E4041A
MNRTPLRGRLLRRTAVTTAAVVAAALLGAPGTGAAQDTASCPEPGTSPMADGIAAALDLAEAYDSVTAIADFSGDGHTDWLARRKSDGALYLYRGNGAGGYSSRVLISTGWNSLNMIA